MEGHMVSAIDLLGIPRKAELPDRLPSPNSWFLWGAGGNCETYGFSGKTSTVESNSASEEFCQGILGGDESSSVFNGISNQSIWLDESGHMDFQLDNIQGVGEAGDLFLNSLLEDFPGNDRVHGQFCDCHHCLYEITHSGNFWGNPSDSPSFKSKTEFMESSNCYESHCFYPSPGCKKETAAPQSVPCNTEQQTVPKTKAQLVNNQDPSEHSEVDVGYPDEEMALEESVLQDLKGVMAQLNKKTRICFRDALYRLANNTKQHRAAMEGRTEELNEDKPPPWTELCQDMKSEKKSMESETNIIDRAIANIIFNRMDFNNEDPSGEPGVSIEQQILAESGIFRFNGLKTLMLPHDHEVPVFSQVDRMMITESHSA